MRRYLISDPEKCTGCRTCELACSEEKEGTYNPRKSRVRLVEFGAFRIMISCRICESPSCVAACVMKALSLDKDRNAIIVDMDKCTGCGFCVDACKYGAINIDPDKGRAFTCDLCGGDPYCVKSCPWDALKLTTPDETALATRRSLVKRLIEAEQIEI